MKTRGIRYTAEEKARIMSRIKAGENLKTIANETNVTTTTLRKWRKSVAEQPAPRTPKPSPAPILEFEDLRQAYIERGVLIKQLQSENRRHANTIKNLAKSL